MAELRAPEQNRLLGQLARMLRTTEGDIAAPEFLPSGLDVMGLVRQLMLPSAETVEKLSYGDPLFRMPMQSSIPITADREYLADVVGMAPMVPAASRGATRLTNEAADALVRAITRNEQATAPAVLEAAGEMLPLSRIISRDIATQIKMPVTLPQSDDFVNAVQNTPGAEITNEGLVMRLQRMQKPEQAGEESVRTGVFYLPEGSASMKYYKSGGDNTYGGSQPISGETLYKNPLFVKGATGGKAPEAAYDQLMGKGAYQKMRNDVLQAANVMSPSLRLDRQDRIARIQETLEEYGSDPSIAGYLVSSSTKGNQLAYAMQENIVANAVRNAGHDAVLGFSQKRTGDKFISEVFDVREATYPTPEGEFTLRPEFAGLLDQPAQSVAETSYRGSHSAPNVETYGATLDSLEGIMPADVYSSRGKRLYGLGNPDVDAEWFAAAFKAKGKPDAEVTIYRAVPKGVKEINSGDWVTTSKTYADMHGENAIGDNYEILSKKVKAKTLSSEGYPYEFGYNE